MTTNRMSIKIGGEAGMGVESSGAGFAKALARGGLHVFALQDYRSQIRGGHNFFQIRVAPEPLYCQMEAVDLLLAFTAEAVEHHRSEIPEGGGIIFDADLPVDAASLSARGIRPLPIPLTRIAEQEGGNEVMMNTAALGVAAGVTQYDFEGIASVIRENFRRKGEEVVERNLRVARAAYLYAQTTFAPDFPYRLSPVEAPRRLLLNGNQALCLGAVLAGCKFVSGYPMTPASTILEWMSAKASRLGIVTKHTEDEIAAICMAIGASHTGVRAMTATSGGGFCLMTEALGLAGATETPLVVVEVQRGGPSTGLPTRTEQGDLEFILHASHGEFPRIALAPGTIEEAFEAGWRAFNLAERYQCPVLIISDQYLASSLRTVDWEALDFRSVSIDRGQLLTREELDAWEGPYRRHAPTPTGVSPRAIPSHPNAVYVTTGDEHTEEGFITEDAELRRQQMEKRMRKLEAAAREIRDPEVYGPEEADITLVGWGSTYGPLRETVDTLNREGGRANLLHLCDIWPFPAARVAEILGGARLTVAVENNYTGQMANVIRAHTGLSVDERILKYDGRPFSAEYIIAQLEEIMVHV